MRRTRAPLPRFSRGLGRELGTCGITVNKLQPGPVDTDMNPVDTLRVWVSYLGQEKKFRVRSAGCQQMTKIRSAISAMLPVGRGDKAADIAKRLATSVTENDLAAVDSYIDGLLDRPADEQACRMAVQVALKLHRVNMAAAARLYDGLRSHIAYASAYGDAEQKFSVKSSRCLPPLQAARDVNLLRHLSKQPRTQPRLPHGWRMIDTIDGGVQIPSAALAALNALLAVDDLFADTPLTTPLPFGVVMLNREERIAVFSHKDVVFKVYNPQSDIAQENDPLGVRRQPGYQYAQTRFDRTKKAAEICASERLSTLMVPPAALIETVHGRQTRVIVEKRLDFSSANEAQEKLYADLDKSVIMQLARFVFLSGSCDAEWRNFPVLSVENTQVRIGIIDAESVGNGTLGIEGSRWNMLEYSNRRGLIAMLSDEGIMREVANTVEGWRAEKVSQCRNVQINASPGVDECIAHRKKEMARSAALDAYLEGFAGHLDRPVQNVKLAGLTQGMDDVVRAINAGIKNNEHVSGRERRHVVLDCETGSVFRWYGTDCLRALQEAGAIYDFHWDGRGSWQVWA